MHCKQLLHSMENDDIFVVAVFLYVLLLATANDISGRVFLRLNGDSIKEFGFVRSGYHTLMDALEEVGHFCTSLVLCSG